MQIITRREVLWTGALMLTAGIPEAGASQAQQAVGARRIQLGAQTNAFPIKPSEFDTLIGALSQIRQTGYAGFETGFANLSSQFGKPEQAKQRLEATGLVFTGIHIFLQEYDYQTNIAPSQLYEPVGRAAAAMGAERLILSGSPAVTPEEVARKAEALNRAGRFSKGLGLKLAYHNHWPEFKWNGKEIEALYAQTNPSFVYFLLDAGHAFRAGADIPAFVKTHHGRLTGIHFRDYKNGVQVPLGQGDFPLAAVAAALEEVRWTGWALNEEEREDGSKLGLQVMEPAFRALKGAFPS
jgi:inosose dehydratase